MKSSPGVGSSLGEHTFPPFDVDPWGNISVSVLDVTDTAELDLEVS